MYRYVITLNELRKLQKQGNVQLVDVRDGESYEKGHIPGAMLLSYTEEPGYLARFQKTKPIVLCCDRGNLSMRATMRLRRAGYPAYSLAGGYEGYRRFQK